MTKEDRGAIPTVANYLQAAMARSGKSVALVAFQTGYSVDGWRQVLTGEAPLDGMRIAKVAAVLNVDPIELGRVTIADYHPEFLPAYDAIPDELLHPEK